MNHGSVVAMIPARIGSERCKAKNLRLIANKPVLAYGIEGAIKANCYDKIVVNGDDPMFERIASSYGVEYHNREKSLSTSSALSDDVVYSFLRYYKCDFVVWHNSIAAWQNPLDANSFVSKLKSSIADSLFTIQEVQLQTCYQDEPINFDTSNKFARTQDLTPIQIFVPFLMGWNAHRFIKAYDDRGHGFFLKSVAYHPVSLQSTYTIKTDHDFRLIRSLIDSKSSYNDDIHYYDGSGLTNQ